jgi:hypothetical protein
LLLLHVICSEYSTRWDITRSNNNRYASRCWGNSGLLAPLRERDNPEENGKNSQHYTKDKKEPSTS